MSRAKLIHLPGFVWHITQRCHNRDFLLKFNLDRKNWLYWLYNAKNKYKLIILNYSVTSNHIHLVVYDDGRKNVIPYSMMLVSSRVALEYNKRKKRSGAFWEDNYHATAIGTDSHLHRCLIYVDLNMVRAKMVDHPKEWPFCGYHELTKNRSRYLLIDKSRVMELLGINNSDDLKRAYENWIKQSLSLGRLERESIWTESIAVGKKDFVEEIKAKLGLKVKNRRVEEVEDKKGGFILRESQGEYKME